jgi:hypothetical protein
LGSSTFILTTDHLGLLFGGAWEGSMSLKNLPLDAGRLGAALCVSVEVKTDPVTRLGKATPDGVPLYVVAVAVTPTDRKAALIEVTVAGEPAGLLVGSRVVLRGLEAFWWEMNCRAGISFRADAIVPTLADLPPETTTPAAAAKGAGK